MSTRTWLLVLAGWVVTLGVTVGVRLWNALTGPLMWGYDAWGHVAYVLFLDLYRAVPWADQGWSYFHPPFHYALGWLLAQAGSGEVLMRGLSLLASAASLATAALAAWLARVVAPERPVLALVAFAAVACLPVHYFMSPMPGNELTEALLTAATLAVFVAVERREPPRLRGAFVVGVLAGLALLSKFSGLLVLLVVLACLLLRPLLRAGWHDEPGRVAGRGLVVVLVALALAAPYYARNIREFGTPFQLSRDFPLVQQVESGQPPGARSWRHYVRFPLEAFSDPNPLAPHLFRSVWASVYLNVWADTYRESDVERALEAERGTRRSTQLMALLGLLSTAVAFAGAGLALGDVWRGRRRAVYLPLLLQTALSLAAFAVFAWRVPLWSALKSSYLLGLSLPYALFMARSFEALAARARSARAARRSRAKAGPCRGWAGRWPRVLLPLGVAGVALAASVVATDGLVLPRRANSPATGAVRFYFGEYGEARREYERLAAMSGYPVAWLDNLAAVELAAGKTGEARRLYARAVALERAAGRRNDERLAQLAAATALDGDASAAVTLFDEVLASQRLPEPLANRGALRAAQGDLVGAEADLRAALGLAPEMVPAWSNLA
ncbi:MAG: glycosyltransferase family 39 protein, partial [Deltaproteobacteria bacterium]|nr:glycosyltransferase family 39 protein [Deltaproteobacteria bacterium]